jgi:ATP-dependent Lon protease
VKEQLNKRKPDEEYAHINMSYINRNGEKVIVYCPESKYSEATQNPRKEIGVQVLTEPAKPAKPVEIAPVGTEIPISAVSETFEEIGPKEKTVDVQYGDTGYSYEDLFGEYLKGAKIVMLEEPYLAHGYQMTDLVRFTELLVKIGDCQVFRLVTKPGETTEESNVISKSLQRLRDTLDDMEDCNMKFEFEFDVNSHDRFIRTSNNWDISLGRGLHFYQNMNPNKDERNYYQMGTYDLSLRPCLKARFTFMKRNAEE